jgi:CubicO group peptidase (beta-lactamase class C family)
VLLSRDGETHVEHADDLRPDTIFLISSMTKPVTAVAAMICVEECLLRLDDPVDEYLPELASRQVLTRLDGPLDDTVPAARAITVRDLLTFRLGLGFGHGMGGRLGPCRSWTRLALWARVPRHLPEYPGQTSGCASSARCRSRTSRASGGSTTPALTCLGC